MEIIIGIIAAILGIGAGYFGAVVLKKKELEKELQGKLNEVEKKIIEAEKLLTGAEKNILTVEKKASTIEKEAEAEARKITEGAKEKIEKIERKLDMEIARTEEREKSLDEKFSEVERQKELFTEKKEVELKNIEKQKLKLTNIIEEEAEKLEKIAKLSKEEAKKELFTAIEKTAENDVIQKMHRMEERMKTEVDEKAKNLIVGSIQRLASDVTSENTISHLELESDDMKGRIIGKEGRNINAFERTTGVNIIVDDTPSVVILSSFDPLRRHIAGEVMKELLIDGRIHPARIEEVMAKKTKEVDKMIQQKGEDAAFEVGITGLAPEVIKVLGRLHFRTSYGQNVLRHSIETAFVAEMLAYELGADAALAKKAGLLHDLGKTLSHEIGGKHALLSGDIGRKFQLDEDLIHAMEAHHEDVPLRSVEAYIIQAADAISASRPGARRETSEKFVKRMVELEGIATSFKGVNKCFAMSAGREMWIFVDPKEISDLDASKLSWDITRRIESDLQYPGEVRVVVHRDIKFIHTAT